MECSERVINMRKKTQRFLVQVFFFSGIALTLANSGENCSFLKNQHVCVLYFNELDLPRQDVLLDAWLEKDLELPQNTKLVTICSYIYLQRIYNSQAYVFGLDYDWGMLIDQKRFKLKANKKSVFIDTNVPLFTWFHTCVTFGSTLTFYLDGKKLLEEKGVVLQDNQLNVKKCYTQVPRDLYPSEHLSPVRMAFTFPRIFPRSLLSSEVKNLSNCSKGKMFGELSFGNWSIKTLSSKTHFNMTDENAIYIKRKCDEGNEEDEIYMNKTCETNGKFDGSSIFSLLPMNMKDICPPHDKSFLIMLEGSYTFEQSESVCKGFNGKLLSLETDAQTRKMKEFLHKTSITYATPFMKKDEMGRCQSIRISFTQFEKFKSNCMKRETSFYVLCDVPGNTTLSLRYFFEDENASSTFDLPVIDDKLVVVRDTDMTFKLASLLGDIMYRNGSVLTMVTGTGMKLKTTIKSGVIIGRNVWLITNSAESNSSLLPSVGSSITMVLTGCKNDEFTCNSGECIKLDKRCDGILDCEDETDENCKILITKLSKMSSQVVIPPYHETPLLLTVEMIRIQNVFVNTNLVLARLRLSTQWKDPRLTFSQLKYDTGDNVIPSNTFIWKPEYRFPNIRFEDMRLYDSHTLTISTLRAIRENDSEPTVHEGREVYLYEGSKSASILRTEEFVAGFYCTFYLYIFPFDVHNCNVNISIYNKGSFLTYFDKDQVKLISQRSVLTLFEVSKLYFNSNENVETKPKYVILSYLLTRRYGSYFITTILPCVLIGFLGSCTHLFDMENFSDRIMVTLSCLIVLATLFSQLNTILPESPAPKAIEILFCYYIIKLSFTFIAHTSLVAIKIKREISKEGGANSSVLTVSSTASPFYSGKMANPTSSINISKVGPEGKSCKKRQFFSENKQQKQGNFFYKRHRLSLLTLNRIYYYFGLTMDVVFVTIFVLYIDFARKKIFSIFAEHQDFLQE